MRQLDKVMIIMEAAQAVGVAPQAMQDAMHRGLQHFEKTEPDRIAARQWAEGLRQEAPHFFPQREAASPQAPAVDPQHPRRPQPVDLTAEQIAALQQLSPTARMSAYRVLQERARAGAPR